MTKSFDKFLLGLLWLMTVALAITFWMNARYGFNIFSSAHWGYLASLQANRVQIDTGFYASFVIAGLCALIGLYFLIRPNFKKVKPDSKASQKPVSVVPQTQPATQPQTHINRTRPLSPNGGRPISLNKPIPPRPNPDTIIAPPTNSMKNPANPNPLGEDIKQIFKSNDYIIKPAKKIDELYNPVVAIGYDQSLWIASSNTTADIMQGAIAAILNIFEDTLGDSTRDMITIHGCIINSNEENMDMVHNFKNISEFRQYIDEHPNKKDEDFDQDLFDAMSTYISTLLTHIGR